MLPLQHAIRKNHFQQHYYYSQQAMHLTQEVLFLEKQKPRQV